MREPNIWFDCYNINVKNQDDYILILDFDQKILFGKRLVHRKLFILKNEICYLGIRTSISEISNDDKEVLAK